MVLKPMYVFIWNEQGKGGIVIMAKRCKISTDGYDVVEIISVKKKEIVHIIYGVWTKI